MRALGDDFFAGVPKSSGAAGALAETGESGERAAAMVARVCHHAAGDWCRSCLYQHFSVRLNERSSFARDSRTA